MQTFLPYANLVESAKTLDKRRLGKQRLEARQILKILQGESTGWRNHPAVLMWTGYEEFLKLYFNVVSTEWQARGCKHTMGFYRVRADLEPPWWYGMDKFHSAHRAALLLKELERGEAPWYVNMGWTETPKNEYWWPVQMEWKGN